MPRTSKARQPRRNIDYGTWREDSARSRNNPTWHWYCMHCAPGSGTGYNAKNARDRARNHVIAAHTDSY